MTSKVYKLFIKSIPWTVADKEIATYFANYGLVKRAYVAFDPTTGVSRRFGFVDFIHKDAYESALNQQVHIIEGVRFIVQPGAQKLL